MNLVHPDYSKLASRIEISNLHKMTDDDYLKVVEKLDQMVDKQGRNASMIHPEVMRVVKANIDKINAKLDYSRDFNYDFFGFKTLERSYLLKANGQIVERPQHMLMRCSLGIHHDDLESAFETYDLMSELWFTHATPTLFNSGTPKPQMSSCFLLTMKEDSIEGIFDTLKQCAVISKNAGGIGLAVHNIRSSESYIRGTNGHSNGLVPMLRVFNDTARYCDQGGGKRKGAFAIYLEPWHFDTPEFLELRKNHGKEESRARDLFYALWIPDLFMKRVKNNLSWTFMCPNECPGLSDCWGEEFEKLYERYEAEGKGKKTIKAQELWNKIIDSQIETGTPYMVYKDTCNRKSNQQNLGTIKSSNLCTEIVEYTSKDEVAVCNLASISLSRFADIKTQTFDYEKLHYVTKRITKNLNKVIDRNYYPVPEARFSNMKHRPIGIGVQGFADALQMLKTPFEDPQAEVYSKLIFETIYHASMQASMELAKVEGHYESFKGSPLSEGKFQFDLWNVKPDSNRYDWDALRKEVMEFGARNSLLVAPMPTASTSQVLGNNESFEPFTANVYTRRVLAGEFVCVNKHLVRDMIELGLWTSDIKNKLVHHNGSVQDIKEIPDHIKQLYKTIWEIPQKQLINLAVARGAYICQSQSLNLYMPNPEHKKMTAMHFYGWEKGLKTGQYYLRSRPARDAIKFTVDMEALIQAADTKDPNAILSALEKVNALNKEAPQIKASVNLGKKVAAPRTGFNDEEKQSSAAKLQKVEEKAESENMDFFECENCGS